MIIKCKGRLISNTAGRLAQKQPSFKECVTAHLNIRYRLVPEEIGRLKWTDLNNLPKMESRFMRKQETWGRGASWQQWSYDVSCGGVVRSENAGISNVSCDENSQCRKSKVSSATSIGWGLVGSKGGTNWYPPMYKSLIFDYFDKKRYYLS